MKRRLLSINKQHLSKLLAGVLGGVVGFINGLLGGGGGSLVVPVYESMLGLESKQAHATAIATILPLCVVSSIIYLVGSATSYEQLGMVTIGVVIGGVLGAFLLKKVANNALTNVFYLIMLYAGVRSLIG